MKDFLAFMAGMYEAVRFAAGATIWIAALILFGLSASGF